MASSETLRTAFMTALDGLERVITSEEQAGALARVRDAGLDLLDEHSSMEGLLEARDEQIAAQVELLTQVDLPLLQVHRSTLCVPFVGEFDAFRTAQIIDELLKAAIARSVSTVVIDLTGALFRDTSTAIDLARVFQALRLIGVRGVLSGVRPELAPSLADMPGLLRDVPCYADLADALAADQLRSGP
jgi:anti-anti-sigma regulatory factor